MINVPGGRTAPKPPSDPALLAAPAAGQSLVMQLVRAREAMMYRLRPLFRAADVTEQQFRVMRMLIEQGEADMQRLARLCCIHPPSLSRIVPKLAARGLVARVPGETDHRRIGVRMMPDGREMMRVLEAQVLAAYAALLEELGPNCVADAGRVLARIIDRLGDDASASAGEES